MLDNGCQSSQCVRLVVEMNYDILGKRVTDTIPSFWSNMVHKTISQHSRILARLTPMPYTHSLSRAQTVSQVIQTVNHCFVECKSFWQPRQLSQVLVFQACICYVPFHTTTICKCACQIWSKNLKGIPHQEQDHCRYKLFTSASRSIARNT